MIPLAVVGCDFRIAPSRARSQLVLNEREILELADSLKQGGWADGIAILDTCNRNEWIVATENPTWAAELLQSRMRKRLSPELRARIEPTIRVGDEAALHLFRVALGRESLVVGERQISGQMFKALARARADGHSARILNGLESTTGRMVRVAQRRGHLESHSVGVHSLAISWLREQLRSEHSQVAVVGMGSIGRRVAAILDNDPRFTTIRVNRTVDPGSMTQPLGSLNEILGQVDAAILCTAAPSPLLDPSTVNIGQNLVLVDLGIPEQVASSPAPPELRCVGLDQLVTWHRNLSAGCPDTESLSIAPLVERALVELRRIYQKPLLAPVIEQVRCRSRLLMRTELKALLLDKLGSISQSERGQIEDEICALLGGYTDDVLHTIREGGQEALRQDS